MKKSAEGMNGAAPLLSELLLLLSLFLLLRLRRISRQVRDIMWVRVRVKPGYSLAYMNVYWASLRVLFCLFKNLASATFCSLVKLSDTRRCTMDGNRYFMRGRVYKSLTMDDKICRFQQIYHKFLFYFDSASRLS